MGGADRLIAECFPPPLDGVYCVIGIHQDESGCYGDELLVC